MKPKTNELVRLTLTGGTHAVKQEALLELLESVAISNSDITTLLAASKSGSLKEVATDMAKKKNQVLRHTHDYLRHTYR